MKTPTLFKIAGTFIIGIICSAARGQIFVANNFSGRIGEYSFSGAPINASLTTGLAYPAWMTGDANNLYVVNQNNYVIGKYTTSGETVNASLITGLNHPYGLVVVVPEPSSATVGILGVIATQLLRRFLRRF